MSEKTLWEWFKGQAAKRGWHAVRVENTVGLGTPDVNYCSKQGMEGWVELKYAPEFPKGKDTRVPVQHPLSPQQEYFLHKRHLNNSCSGILVQVGKERFFIPAQQAQGFNQMTEWHYRRFDILEQWLGQE